MTAAGRGAESGGMETNHPVTTRAGQRLIVRPLRGPDAVAFGRFLDELGPATRMFFGPHPLDAAEARRLCAAQPEAAAGRWVAEAADGRIVGYFILELGLRAEDAARYQARGQTLDAARAVTLAPVIADDWQDRGVAGAAFPIVVAAARAAGRDRLVLMGGTQQRNARAVRFYQREGFVAHGEFEHPPGIWNLDMTRPL